MGEVKRILWVDDIKENPASCLFSLDETKIVETMADAIREFSGENLYKYDTIVLDIDFEDGLGDPDYVIPKLREKIYLSNDQAENKYIKDNGGYLLFLYLLERGYPSSQIAFLTGYSRIIDQLREFNTQCLEEMTKEDITDAIWKAWEKASKENDEVDEYWDSFEKIVHTLPIHARYKKGSFLEKCEDRLSEIICDSKKYEEGLRNAELETLRKIVDEVPTDTISDMSEHTGDKIIFRFHDANLEAPNYFTKNEHDIDGHDREDAQNWLNGQRTQERICRWILLDAGDYVEECFRSDLYIMNRQIGGKKEGILKRIPKNRDGGIRSAFRQMYLVLDGLRAGEHKGVFYQAVWAILVPFEAKVEHDGYYVDAADEHSIRRMCARCVKQARNYCAHNYMGTTLSVETTLFISMLAMTAVLNCDQREKRCDWYQRAASVINEKFVGKDNENANIFRDKVEGLVERLSSERKIILGTETCNGVEVVTPRKILEAMGNNIELNKSKESNVEKREEYYVFTIALYILEWFEYASIDVVKDMYDQSVPYVYEIAQHIVRDYEYPY